MTARPPYSRTERAIALGRIAVAIAGLVIAWHEGATPFGTGVLRVLLCAYVLYSMALVPILSPAVQPAGWWPLTTLMADALLIATAVELDGGAVLPFLAYVLFAFATATVRWGSRGALWTGAALVSLFAAASAHERAGWTAALDQLLPVALAACVFAGLGAAHGAERRRLESLASWPPFSSGDRAAVSQQMLDAAARVLRAPRLLLVWEDSEEPWVETAAWHEGRFQWQRQPPTAFGTIVAEPLTNVSFVCTDLDAPRPRVQTVHEGRAGAWSGIPIDTGLRARFPMHSVVSWPVRDSTVSGRLFSLDPDQYGVDDVAFGEVVARLIGARLALGELLREVHDRAAAEGRLKIANDLHDGVLQSLAAAALQVQAARRLQSVDPAAADARLAELQQIVAAEQAEIRTVIEALAPDHAGPRGDVALEGRLRAVCARMTRQWGIEVRLALEPPNLALLDTLAQQVFLLVQEALVNVGRHAAATHASVAILQSGAGLAIVVSDDGHGFGVTGRLEHDELRRRDLGPRSLRQRVAALGGTLTIDSSPRGARIEIHVPYLGATA